jgi:hypothetical protein
MRKQTKPAIQNSCKGKRKGCSLVKTVKVVEWPYYDESQFKKAS